MQFPTGMNYEQARYNMVEQQIRPCEVLDTRVLDVIQHTPRENFVPARYKNLAFAETRIPLGHDQVMMCPTVEGRLLQALDIHKTDVVLEVGTGSGYLTACLATLAEHVHSVDIHADFTEAARKTLNNHGISNITLSSGDAAKQWDRLHKYDVIALTGSVPVVPDYYKQALAIDGRLFVIVGDTSKPIMEAWLITRLDESQWVQESLFDTVIPPLINADPPRVFDF